MIETAGWHLPDADNYFAKFIAPGKGFQREHLLEAFKHVRKWDVAVDVGAHVGFFSYYMASHFAEVVAFEAAGDTFACLERNMAEFANVELYNMAVGAEPGAATVEDDPTRPGNTGSRFIRPGQGEIIVLPLDDFDLPACDLLKIDVEGYELAVLWGAKGTIAHYSPVVIMETDKKFAEQRYGAADDGAEKWLLNRGYREVAHMRPDKVFVPRA